MTSTSIPLTWTSAGSEGVRYRVLWQRVTSVGCSEVDSGSTTTTITDTSYTIAGLEEDSSYSITVRASNTAGNEDSNAVTAMTLEAGERDSQYYASCHMFCSAAPSAPPDSVTAATTATTITVQWGEVDCIHRNGEITGYSVRYGEMGTAEEDKTVRLVSGDDNRQTVISGLTPSTDYTIEVAAVNVIGTGSYSTSIVQETNGGNVTFYTAHGLGYSLVLFVFNRCIVHISNC